MYTCGKCVIDDSLGGAANIAHPSIEGVAAVGDEVVTAKNGERSRS